MKCHFPFSGPYHSNLQKPSQLLGKPGCFLRKDLKILETFLSKMKRNMFLLWKCNSEDVQNSPSFSVDKYRSNFLPCEILLCCFSLVPLSFVASTLCWREGLVILSKLSSCIACLSNRPSTGISEWCHNIPSQNVSVWRWKVQWESADVWHYTDCDFKNWQLWASLV